MVPANQSAVHRIAFAALLVMITWIAAARSDELPDATVIAPKPPSNEELTEDSLSQFIVHHATTPYPKSQTVTGSLARWRGGRPETICPLTLGLDPGYNAFVSARVRALAAYVGAPVQTDLHCTDNVRILFTTEPQKLMEEVLKWANVTLGVKYPHQTAKQLTISSGHAIQGWYLTAAGGGSILNEDAKLLRHIELLPLWPLVIQTGLHGGGCCNGGIIGAFFIVDTTKVVGYTIGSVADYIAVLAMTLIQSPDHCDPLPSILDLMSSNCSAPEKPAGITAGDLAFLKALYYRNTGLGPSLSRADMQFNMMRQFNTH
jgi:hypothetical protein